MYTAQSDVFLRRNACKKCSLGSKISLQQRTSLSTFRSLSTTATVTSDDLPPPLNLHVLDFTPPDADIDPSLPPIIFLHGLLGQARNFSSLAKRLGQQATKHRIFAVDLRHHGKSQLTNEANNINNELASLPILAHDVAHVIQQQLAVPQATIVGHSLGGKVAQYLALTQPELLAGLIILDIAPVQYGKDQDPDWFGISELLYTMNQVPTTGAIERKQVDKILSSVVPDPSLRAFVLTNWDHKQKQWAIPVQTLYHSLSHFAEFPIAEKNAQFNVDTLFIAGGASKFVRKRHLPAMDQYFPNHRLTTLPGIGHWVHVEAPGEVVGLIQKYLEK